MAIFRKSHLNVYLQQLDTYYKDLRDTLAGDAPNNNVSHDYNCEADQFSRDFTDIDLDKLHFAISHFKVAVEGLKTIDKKKAKPNHKS